MSPTPPPKTPPQAAPSMRRQRTRPATWASHSSAGIWTSPRAQSPPTSPPIPQPPPNALKIEDIARQSFGQFHPTRFDDAQVQIVRKYFRNCLIYAEAATTNGDLDAIKEVARTNADDLALYASTAWGASLDTAGLRLFAKPDILTPGSVAPPDPETLTVTRTAQQLTAGNLAALLA